jgi:hypothetical protein
MLKRIPSTRIVRFLDYWGDLTAEEQHELADALVDRGSNYLTLRLPSSPPSGDAYSRFAEATQWRGFGGGLRYTPIKLLAGVAKDSAIGGLPGWCRTLGFSGQSLIPPESLLAGVESIVPVKTASLRRRLEAALIPLAAPKVRKMGEGMWNYRGMLDGCAISLTTIYGQRLCDPDLQYTVVIERGGWLTSNLTCYEALLGVGNGAWDYLTEENVDRSVVLLCELLQWLARFVAALPNSPEDVPANL